MFVSIGMAVTLLFVDALSELQSEDFHIAVLRLNLKMPAVATRVNQTEDERIRIRFLTLHYSE